MRTIVLGIAIFTPLIFAGAEIASSQPALGLIGFRSPSNNIHCQYFEGGPNGPFEKSALRCDIKSMLNSPPRRPKDCDLEWGQAFEVSENNKPAERLCYGDTVADDRLPILQYEDTWKRGQFICKSERNGVSCITAKAHGFELSRGAQRLF